MSAHALGWGTKYHVFCQPIDYSNTETATQMARTVWLYFILKVVDLLDTVFFVLRKKNNQISFLHVYHHGMMVILTWATTKFLPGGHGTFLGYTNSIVHAVMYAYYFITSMWPEYKGSFWWKKYITQLQMIQFVLIGLHASTALVIENCEYPTFMALTMIIQSIIMFKLFYDFYQRAYVKKIK
ncbi:elongation of very long chain fatty acids protein 7-like [Cryptotermes secundus]|uniref:elongation of very long chain fatty acids protein 7-like n=1 Tax=Cryptotermes secundus TaxID=105785 RepID=UPI001454DE1F|nr:elongation of very long chain fatty acids protein 7-like [Cryptotermes secundus]